MNRGLIRPRGRRSLPDPEQFPHVAGSSQQALPGRQKPGDFSFPCLGDQPCLSIRAQPVEPALQIRGKKQIVTRNGQIIDVFIL